MKLAGTLVAVVLAASLPFQPGDRTPANTGHDTNPVERRAPEPPTAPLFVGDTAPDFSFQGPDRKNVRLRDLLAQGHVLLVFAPDEPQLKTLERERDALLDLGVVPVAVVETRSGAANTLARRLELHFPLVPDVRRIVAGQFDAVDENSQTMLPTWFVVDRSGRVRATTRGPLPRTGWTRLAATVLAIPTRDVSIPAHTR